MIRCNVISKEMRRSHGPVIHLELPTALKLQRAGHIKMDEILDRLPGKADLTSYLFRDGFLNNGGLKVAWVQDYDKDGGAELSNYVVVAAGEKLGLDIVSVTPSGFRLDPLVGAEVIVVNNLFNFGDVNYQKILKCLYECGKPYVKYEHDHREITERKSQAARLFENSSLNVFISPRQMKNHIDAFPSIHGRVFPLAIDVKRFVPVPGIERKKNSVFVPGFDKCREETVKYIIEHPEYEYTLVGLVDMPNNPNVKGVRKIEPDSMPNEYCRHEILLHLPTKVGGGERVIFEGALCGCRVVANENAAHTSWKEFWDWEDATTLREKLARAPYDFWREVCRLA